jgi:two-component system, OmpR family, sensor histidine kinase ChvG
MSLRRQLLAFGLLTLVLPWAGYRFVQEMEAALRSGLEQALLASAGTVAAALGAEAPLIERRADLGTPRGPSLYAAPLAGAPRVDGVRDDWATPDDAAFVLEGGHRLWIGVRDRYVHVYFAARDRNIVYEGSPGQSPYGDRLILAVESEPNARSMFVLGTSAPGAFRARRTSPPLFIPTDEYEDRIQSVWQETPEGFAVEVRLPLNLVGEALGVALIDVDPDLQGYRVSVAATWDIDSEAPGPLVYQRPELERVVRTFGQTGDRLRVIDAEGWMLSDTGPSEAPAAFAADVDGPAGALFRYLLRRDDPAYDALERPLGRLADPALRRALGGDAATAWYRGGPDQSATVVAAAPILAASGRVLGAVLLEQRSDPILTLTNQALLRLMSFTLLSTLVVALGLLGYATLLSFRVRRLARAAENALGPKGEIDVALPGRNAKDELGDLSRSFANLLERLREHTQYLKTLAAKLSHELRTPLAVVSTSLDNLEQEVDSPGARPYLERLRAGASRLDSILAAMSEATRMEQAICDTEPQRFDLAAVVEACATAYADIFPDRHVEARIETPRAETMGSGELVAQLIDKLIDNAVGFSTPGSTIDIALEDRGAELELSVANRGRPLPAEMRERLFDSLVSMREGPTDDGRPHLGLGLYIVALIAEFHGGSVTADNLPDGAGAVFRVRFPRR